MGVLMVLGWLGVMVVGVGLCGHLAAGHRALTSGADERSSREEGGSTATPCAGQQVLTSIEEHLKALTQALLTMSKNSEAGWASSKDVLELKNKLVVMETALEAAEAKVSGASTFIRWGRKTCPDSSQLLYSGVAGGSHYSHPGAAANALCLTMRPQFDSTPKPQFYNFVFGAEYQHLSSHHDQDVPCSVCRTLHPTTLMIPSTHSCPPGWIVQYKGHLAAGYHNHPAASEFLCLDIELENRIGGHQNMDGKLFYYVVYHCGSLPCPPYNHIDKIALCVVCSI